MNDVSIVHVHSSNSFFKQNQLTASLCANVKPTHVNIHFSVLYVYASHIQAVHVPSVWQTRLTPSHIHAHIHDAALFMNPMV